ncbi:dienelactone hydrolase family protein [Skermania piniformis]|uniref:Dienelactone hydrolase family protein n=1 Tax=Skermania pinensis TaxID=39122 RepID=A0ABX8S6W9_9ACTN|nr:dienelactone hydrolase family protein [Skermania piniformis]QXQ13498.1 dienelactone hydrolase family protein [Skermania piniformis]
MIDIDVATPNGTIGAVVAQPAGAGPWPGVVVVHDALGMNDDLRSIARRIADQGYLVILPDLYSRGGVVRCLTSVYRDLLRHRGSAFADLGAARDLLRARPDCTGKVAVVGFCLGGGFALVLANQGFDASAPFYPSIPPTYAALLDGACPVVASFGARDPINIGNGARLERALVQRGIRHDVRTYPGAGHSFANQVPVPALARVAGFVGFGYDAAAADDAWRRVFAFFGEHLR